MRYIEFFVTENEAGRSVASILKNELMLSSGLCARLKRVKLGILKNGASARTNERVFAGDTVSAAVGESPNSEISKPLPFPILFEDEDILIIDKPSGYEVHGAKEQGLSVETAVNAYFGKQGLFHPVNRLDRGTTGAMAIAKNGYMHDLISKQLHTGDFERVYIGICDGIFEEKQGRIAFPIAKVGAIKRAVSETGAHAVTNFRVLEEKNGLSMVEFILETGRTHQIRVHTSHLGRPLVGDFLYGTENKLLVERAALHSSRLALTHPLTGKGITIVSPLPDDMKKLMQ